MVACKCCQLAMVHPNTTKHSSMSAMGKHLDCCPMLDYNDRKQFNEIKSKQGNVTSNFKKVIEFTEHEYCFRALRMQLANHLSFNFWRNLYTREFIELLKGDALPLNRHNMTSFLAQEAEQIRNLISEKLKYNTSKISLALDAWSGVYTRKSYMCKIQIRNIIGWFRHNCAFYQQ